MQGLPLEQCGRRALRGFALGRKSWLFAGSERGADRAAAIATLIMTAKLNDIDPLLGSPTCSAASPTSHRAGFPMLPWNWNIRTWVAA